MTWYVRSDQTLVVEPAGIIQHEYKSRRQQMRYKITSIDEIITENTYSIRMYRVIHRFRPMSERS